MTMLQIQMVSKFVYSLSSLAMKRIREIENFHRSGTNKKEVVFGGGFRGCFMEEIAFDLGSYIHKNRLEKRYFT